MIPGWEKSEKRDKRHAIRDKSMFDFRSLMYEVTEATLFAHFAHFAVEKNCAATNKQTSDEQQAGNRQVTGDT